MTTLLLMVLLAVVAVGLLGLASITIRSGAQSLAIAEARANARLALMLAIGDLQKHAGPDQRITATGGILAESAANPHWTGVWDSWKAGAETSAADPPSAHATIAGSARSGMAAGYDASRSKHFRKWLVSEASPGATPASEEVAYAASQEFGDAIMPPPDGNSVTLVSNGSLNSPTPKQKVKAGLVAIARPASGSQARKAGRYGWWIGDESTKARIKDDPFRGGPPLSNAAKSFRLQSPGRAGISQLPGFDKIPADAELGKVMTRRSVRLLDGAADAVADSFHDASPYPLGLLTDVREGGLKRDLSTILERPINLTDKGDPFMLYRFDSAGQEQVPIQDLAAYYQLYRSQLKHSSAQLRSGLQVNNPDFGSGGQAFTREYTSLYRQPIPIRVQFLLSLLCAPRTPAEIAANPNNKDSHKLHVGITPAITFWNPNNVPLAMNLGPAVANQFRFFNMPFTLRWTKEGKGYTSSKAGVARLAEPRDRHRRGPRYQLHALHRRDAAHRVRARAGSGLLARQHRPDRVEEFGHLQGGPGSGRGLEPVGFHPAAAVRPVAQSAACRAAVRGRQFIADIFRRRPPVICRRAHQQLGAGQWHRASVLPPPVQRRRCQGLGGKAFPADQPLAWRQQFVQRGPDEAVVSRRQGKDSI